MLTSDAALSSELRRLCAVAGLPVEVAVDVGDVRTTWLRAAVVLLDPDRAEAVQRQGLPRRSGVLLLGRDIERLDVWRLATAVGAEAVLALPTDEQVLVDRLALLHEPPARAQVIALLPAAGGAGTSTLAAACAVLAAQTADVALVDADPLAGGLDLALGAEQAAGARWPDLDGASGVIPARSLYDALPCVAAVRLLTADHSARTRLTPESVAAVVASLRRMCDLVVLDLPPAQDPAVAQFAADADRVLLVAVADVRTAAAARHAAELLGGAAELGLVVRTRRHDRLRPAAIARALRLPLLGEFATEPSVAAAVDRGALVAALRRTALERCARRIVEHRATA